MWIKAALAAAAAAFIFAQFSYVAEDPLALPEVQQWALEGDFLNFNGHAVFYRTAGDCSVTARRPVLLVLHGFPTSALDFAHILPALTERFCVILPDFLGFGLSDKPPAYPYTIVEQADIATRVAVAAVPAVAADGLHLLAHDYGNSVALELLARDARLDGSAPPPFAIRTVAFLNGGVVPAAHRPLLTQRLLALPYVGPALAALLTRSRFIGAVVSTMGPTAKAAPPAAALEAMWRLAAWKGGVRRAPLLLAYMAERRRHERRWTSALRSISCAAVFLDGPADPISGRHMGAAVRDVWAGGDGTGPGRVPRRGEAGDGFREVVFLDDGVGHWPQVEAPAAVAAALAQFWKRAESQGGAGPK